MQKQRIIVLVFFLACLSLTVPPAHGEFYRYVDADGMVYFTDDYGTIPQQYRSAVTVIQEPGSETESGSAAKEVDSVKDKAGAEKKSKLTAEDIARFEEERTALSKEKNLLEERGKSLSRKKKDLEAEKQEILESNKVRNNRADRKTKEKLEEINRKLTELGKKVKQHNQDIQDFNQKATDFETRVVQAGGKPAP